MALLEGCLKYTVSAFKGVHRYLQTEKYVDYLGYFIDSKRRVRISTHKDVSIKGCTIRIPRHNYPRLDWWRLVQDRPKGWMGCYNEDSECVVYVDGVLTLIPKLAWIETVLEYDYEPCQRWRDNPIQGFLDFSRNYYLYATNRLAGCKRRSVYHAICLAMKQYSDIPTALEHAERLQSLKSSLTRRGDR